MPVPVRRRLACAALALSLASGAARAEPPPDERSAYDALAKARVAQAQGSLDRAGPGYVLVLGDSNAAAAPDDAVGCGGAVVNAGIGGVRTAQYLGYVGSLRLPPHGAAAVINVGTGDAWRALGPMEPGSIAAYEAGIARLVRLAAPHVATVVVSALPPLSGRPAVKLDPEAVGAYSARLRDLCGRIGCTYADPWSSIRGEGFGIALPGSVPDGLHPADPGAAYRSISGAVCGAGRRAAGIGR